MANIFFFWKQWIWQGKRRKNFYSSEVQNTYIEWESFDGDVSIEYISYNKKNILKIEIQIQIL